MRTLTVRQIDLKDECKHVRLHTLPFPEMSDAGFYRTAISYAAFFESTKRRNKSDRYLFLVVNQDAAEFQTPYELERDAVLPRSAHTDLLDFFENIGYDRKAKRFRQAPN